MLAVVTSDANAANRRWKCNYETMVSPSGLKQEQLELEFVADDVTGKAVMIGNNGMSDAAAHVGRETITFMEMLDTGVVQTTTITAKGDSVHSRHTVMAGRIVPSQYYGRCSAS